MTEHDELLDELARCFIEAALDDLLRDDLEQRDNDHEAAKSADTVFAQPTSRQHSG